MPPAADPDVPEGEPASVGALRAAIAAQRARNAASEQALAEVEERLEMLKEAITAVPGAAFINTVAPDNPRPQITFIGGQAERILGYSFEEWRTEPGLFAKMLHPDDAERVMTRLRVNPFSSAPADEYRFIARDGRLVWVAPQHQVIRDEDGKLAGRCGVLLDVTARKVAEKENAELLERSERLSQSLEQLIATVPGVVWEIRADPATGKMAVTFISPQIEAITGYSPSEWGSDIGMWQRIVHPEDQERAARAWAAIHQSGVGVVHSRWITKDGAIRWVENHVRALRNDRGEIIGARGITMDITAQKLADEERARQKEELIRAQAAAMEELGTPLIPISEEIMVMPLVGGVDRARAERVIEALLQGISRARARFAIIDITGVPRVGADTAEALVRAARAVALLGAKVVLTGVRPEVAQTFVTLGTDLQGILTSSTLESGIAHAKRERRGHRPISR